MAPAEVLTHPGSPRTPLPALWMAGGNSNVSIVFDATGKVTDTYQANLIIASDDPDEPQVTVPVTLIVTPVDIPDIDVTPTSLSVTLDVGGTMQSTLIVGNTGQGVLSFQVGETPSVAWLSESPSTGTV